MIWRIILIVAYIHGLEQNIYRFFYFSKYIKEGARHISSNSAAEEGGGS